MNNGDFLFYKVGGLMHLGAAGLIICLYKYGHYLLASAVGFAVCVTWWILLSVAWSAVKKRNDMIEDELRK